MSFNQSRGEWGDGVRRAVRGVISHDLVNRQGRKRLRRGFLQLRLGDNQIQFIGGRSRRSGGGNRKSFLRLS